MSYKLNIYNGDSWDNILKDLHIELDSEDWTSDNLNSLLGELKQALDSKKSRKIVKTYFDYTAVPFDVILVDTSDNVTITLPPNPIQGDRVQVIDASGNAATMNIMVNRNSHNINGKAININIDINFASIELVYDNVTNGWHFYMPMNISGAGSSVSDLKKFSNI